MAESCGANVPSHVNSEKAWALLNKWSYDTSHGNDWTPWQSWQNHQRPLMNKEGWTSSPENEQEKVLQYYHDHHLAGEKWIEIENNVRLAVKDWSRYGPNSLMDPVNGAVGFTDLRGLFDQNGKEPDYNALNRSYSDIQAFRKLFLGWPHVTVVYDLGPTEYGEPVYNFTVFDPPSY